MAVCLFGVGGASVPQPADAVTQESLRADSFYTNLSDHRFIDQFASELEPASLLGKFTLVNFVFTQCGTICPVQTMMLGRAVGALPKSVSSQLNLLSIALDPANDTAEKLREFHKTQGSDLDNWSFIVGDTRATAELSDRLSLMADDTDSAHGQINHRTDLWLIDREGVLLHIYPGNGAGIERIAEDLKRVVTL